MVVIIAALAQHRPSLALGNAIGSSVSNILGAFGLGLLFQSDVAVYDTSSRIYAALLFGITSVVLVVALAHGLGRIFGAVAVVAFGMYVASVGWYIYKGVLAAPEDSDSDSDSDGEQDGGEEGVEAGREEERNERRRLLADDDAEAASTETCSEQSSGAEVARRKQRSLAAQIGGLVVGLIALSVAGYVTSTSAGNLADALHIPDSVFGATVLAFVTTLPENLVAVLSGFRGHSGIVVANTAGSNIFLLTLCLGVVLLATGKNLEVGKNQVFGLVVTWASTTAFAIIVLCGGRRWMGFVLIMVYIGYLVSMFVYFGGIDDL